MNHLAAVVRTRWLLVWLGIFSIVGCSGSSNDSNGTQLQALETACVDASMTQKQFCDSQCARLRESSSETACSTTCVDEQVDQAARCESA
ncbi:MAG: hypothetical protein AAF699_19690, partial [Pseudomonadota bacterium]